MKTRFHSEKGSTILAVVLVIMVITLFGIASLKSSNSELSIARNARCYKQNVYRAEAAVVEVAQAMINETNGDELKPDSTTHSWLIDESDLTTADFELEADDWRDMASGGFSAQKSPLFPDNESSYMVIFEGVAPGDSLDMTNSTHVWQYGVYGLSELCEGRAGVVAGFRKRF